MCYQEKQRELQVLATELYLKFLNELYSKYNRLLSEVVRGVAQVDLYKSVAKTARQCKYCRPTIVRRGGSGCDYDNGSDEAERGSYVEIRGLRHPLIEKIQTDREYVPHDISLSDNSRGMLLYGVNSSGKSSVMKAVGIAIIMAQAGFYVAAESFSFYPYTSVMTRILGNDNLFKGLSSFAVEMSELRGILHRSNCRSLILGDEICHGTETDSALALVAASIVHLSQTGANFIFATHLHKLGELKVISELQTVKSFHLSVQYDSVRDELIYDRKLRSGAGQSLYGLEVARAMKIPSDILDLANSIRKEHGGIAGEILATDNSRYNSDVYLDMCKIDNCGKRADAVHHINFQSEADDCGMIRHYHKHTRHNLVTLCAEHHLMVHQPVDRELIIFGYLVSGKLDYTFRKPLKTLRLV